MTTYQRRPRMPEWRRQRLADGRELKPILDSFAQIPTMRPSEYEPACTAVGLTLRGSSKFFGVNETTVYRWARQEDAVPRSVQIALALMAAYELTPADVEDIMRGLRQ